MINPNSLKNKLYDDCGINLFNFINNNQDYIKSRSNNEEHFKEMLLKADFHHLILYGYDKEIKELMLDVVKDNI